MIEINDQKLNIQKLNKGDYLSLDVLREVTGFDPGENVDVYRLAVLKIRGQIEREHNFTTRADGYAIRILTDAEAVYQNEKTRDHGVRKMERSYRRAIGIDENNLDQFTTERHRTALLTHSKVLGAVATTLKQIRSEGAAIKPPRNHSDSKVRFISTKEITDGTTTSQSDTNGNRAADFSQRANGESATPAGKTDEGINEQAK